MSISHTRSATEGDLTRTLPSPAHGYIGGQIAAIFSPSRQEEIVPNPNGTSTPQAKTRKQIVFKPYFKERGDTGKLIKDTSKESSSPTKVDTQEDQGLFNLTQKKNASRMSNIRTFEGPTLATTERSKTQMQQYLDSEMHDMHTARDSVFKNEHTTTMATKSFDNRKLETPHPKLSSYLSTGTLSVASNVHIKTDAFLMRGIPQKDALFASKAMRESVELAKLQEERKKIARFSHAFSSIGRDRSNPHFIGVYEENKPSVGLYSVNVDALKPNKPSAIIPRKITFSSSKTPQPIYKENEKFENYFPKIHEDKRDFQRQERESVKKRGLPKSTQKAVKDLRTLWQMDFDFRFYKDLRKNYGEKIVIPPQIKMKPTVVPFDDRKMRNKQRDIFEKNHVEYDYNSKTGRFKPRPLKEGLFAPIHLE